MTVICLVAACGGSPATSDGGNSPDSGVTQDAGSVTDAGGAPDSGIDAGMQEGGPDAGAVDAGTDAGMTADAGAMDAGETDAGMTDAGTDAGIADAGMDAGIADAGMDAGIADAGMDAGMTDAGETDAGETDAGETDAGAVDAGTDAGDSDAGVDGGALDGGFSFDGGIFDGGVLDAGMNPSDAGTMDAGMMTMADAGSSDAGMMTMADAGSSDAGMMTMADAGTMDAGMMTMADAGSTDGGAVDCSTSAVQATTEILNNLAMAMTSFQHDSGGWPSGNSVWYGSAPSWDTNYSPSEIMSVQFTTHDTALFALPIEPDTRVSLASCSSNGGAPPCWQGPYLSMSGATSLADVKDCWGSVLYYEYMAPFGYGGGSPLAPNGAIVIWSAGPDKLDQTGCTNTGCSVSEDNIASGQPSVPGADDIIVVVSSDAASN